MRGISIYLGNQSVKEQETYIQMMQEHGFRSIFTSLHIPEADHGLYREQLKTLGGLAGIYRMELMADVSTHSLKALGYDWSNAERLLEWGLTGLRIDFGIPEHTIIELSQKMKIALNASTINLESLQSMKENGLNISSVEAWHNYYPRPETGLGFNDFCQKNKELKQEGLRIMAFIPGDSQLRGPIFESLPTLEKHRHQNPFECYLELQSIEVDKIIIGDSGLSNESLEQFQAFERNEILLHAECFSGCESLMERIIGLHTNRPDAARDCIRSTESRHVNKGRIQPCHCFERPVGTITIDNEKYLRYQGEIQITKTDLPADNRVNTVGRVVEKDRPLLQWIQGNQKFRIQAVNQY